MAQGWRTTALSQGLAAQSEKKVTAVCDHTLGLRDELAEHMEALNMGAGGSHSRVTMMLKESAPPGAASHPFATPTVGTPFPGTQGLRAVGQAGSRCRRFGREDIQLLRQGDEQ